jgi:endonuclease/exonuclease/phosphatase family metal-dependent hydrolase
VLALVALASAGCAPLNYTHPREPSYVRCCLPAPSAGPPDSLRLVSFNVRFAREVRRAIATLRTAPELAGADLVLLQEMDAPGTSRVARALGLNSVYYPAVRHPASGRDFGNAILSRWPIERVAKLVLPHRGRFGGTQRIATGAQVAVGGTTVLVVSFHLATPIEVGPAHRRAQADAIVDWCDRTPADLAIVGGDLNDAGLVRRFTTRGFACPTLGQGPTSVNGLALDQVLVRRRSPGGGFDERAALGDARVPAGVVAGDRVTSDHYPIWARIPLAASAPACGPTPSGRRPARGRPGRTAPRTARGRRAGRRDGARDDARRAAPRARPRAGARGGRAPSSRRPRAGARSR